MLRVAVPTALSILCTITRNVISLELPFEEFQAQQKVDSKEAEHYVATYPNICLKDMDKVDNVSQKYVIGAT